MYLNFKYALHLLKRVYSSAVCIVCAVCTWVIVLSGWLTPVGTLGKVEDSSQPYFCSYFNPIPNRVGRLGPPCMDVPTKFQTLPPGLWLVSAWLFHAVDISFNIIRNLKTSENVKRQEILEVWFIGLTSYDATAFRYKERSHTTQISVQYCLWSCAE